MSEKFKIDLIFQVSVCVNDMEAAASRFVRACINVRA